MPFYDYKCKLGHTTTEFMTIKNYINQVICQTCGKIARRDMSSCTGFVKGGPRTVGMLAEENSRKLGVEKIRSMEMKAKYKKYKTPLPDGVKGDRILSPLKNKNEINKMRKIAKMTPGQQKEYIERGTI